jgi:RNA polymerase sigma-70 factor (ECF subfamily)
MDDLDALYRSHAPAVLRFCWGLCGDRTEAEDLVSETFVRLVTRAPRLETGTALAYLLAVARNAFLNRRRRGPREIPLPEEIAASESDPSQRVDDRARLGAVLRALAGLSEGERAALLLRVDHELPYEEIAAVLQISSAAARVRVHRARIRLAAAPGTGGRTG